MKTTPETLTDDQVHELGVSTNDTELSWDCIDVLSGVVTHTSTTTNMRQVKQRICDVINKKDP
jgi:hypothetical protein